MPDYKEMYLKMVRASEAAIDMLVSAQRECEDMYIETDICKPRKVQESKDKKTTSQAEHR